jgi:hypothetical protein
LQEKTAPIAVFYLQPPQVLQLPLHFFVGFPVAEYIHPAQSRAAAVPQSGHATASS